MTASASACHQKKESLHTKDIYSFTTTNGPITVIRMRYAINSIYNLKYFIWYSSFFSISSEQLRFQSGVLLDCN